MIFIYILHNCKREKEKRKYFLLTEVHNVHAYSKCLVLCALFLTLVQYKAFNLYKLTKETLYIFIIIF